jgi:DNA-binding NarL/FixJ family response regulator
MASVVKKVSVFEGDHLLLSVLSKEIEISRSYVLTTVFKTSASIIPLLKISPPDVLVFNVDYNLADAFEKISSISSQFPQVDILVLSAEHHAEQVITAFQAGAKGYLLTTAVLDVIDYLNALTSGGSPIHSLVARQLVEKFHCHTHRLISQRERQVLRLLVNGRTHTKIATELSISAETARSHIKNIYKKLQVNSRSEVVRKAIEQRIIAPNAFANG